MNLKPCPFCGSHDVESDAAGIITETQWIVCNTCGASGPFAQIVDGKLEGKTAVELWNQRKGHSDQMRERIEIAENDRRGESWRAILKLGEEFGELCEAVLIDEGSLAYKDKETSTIDECADILNAVAAFLGRHYPDLSADEIMELLEDAGRRKIDKYLRIVRKKQS